MPKVLSGKTLIPISLIIAMIPGAMWLVDSKARCDILTSDVIELKQEKVYLRNKIDQITYTLSKIEISIGVIEHEVRDRKPKEKI